eukprot:scpid60526/ scgid4457/ 
MRETLAAAQVWHLKVVFVKRKERNLPVVHKHKLRGQGRLHTKPRHGCPGQLHRLRKKLTNLQCRHNKLATGDDVDIAIRSSHPWLSSFPRAFPVEHRTWPTPTTGETASTSTLSSWAGRAGTDLFQQCYA